MNEQKDSQTIVGAGKVFAEGRESLDLSREQTADILNLSVRMVRALEESKPDQLPEKVYVNGYIRSYAKLLGLASQPLIDAWWAQHTQHTNDIGAEEPIFDRAAGAKELKPFKMGRWAALGLVLSAVFIYFVGNSNPVGVEEEAVETPVHALATTQTSQDEVSDEPSPTPLLENTIALTDSVDVDTGGRSASESTANESTANESTANETLQQVAVAESTQGPEAARSIAPERAIEEQIDSQLSVVGALDETADQQVAGNARANEPLAIGASDTEFIAPAQEDSTPLERETPTAYALPRLTALGDDEIRLRFTSDCWFELRDESGVLLYADLGRAGQARRYIGAGPFRVKLGYSPGVTLSFNGGEVDLQPFTRRDVANLTVGAEPPSGAASQTSPST